MYQYNKNKFLKATEEPYNFAYIDKINKTSMMKLYIILIMLYLKKQIILYFKKFSKI